MTLKDLRNKSMRKRSLAFLFGASKWTSTSTAQESPVQYDDKPKKQSPRIERPKISPELESQIRYSCALLYYSIEREEIKQYAQYQEEPVTLSKQTEDTKTGVHITTDYLSPSVSMDKDSQEGKHDSGIGFDVQQSSNQTSAGGSMTRFYQQNLKNLGRHSTTTTAPGSPERRNMADDGDEIFLHPDSMSFARKVPSFYWPKSASRYNDQKVAEDIRPSSRESQKRSAAAENISERATRQNRDPDGIPERPKNSIEIEAIPDDENDQYVIIDKNGVVHVMSAEEESQRQVDLQKAVMEKMRTGAIGSSTQVDCDGLPSHEAPQIPQPCHSKYEKESRVLPKLFQPLEQKRGELKQGVSTVFPQSQTSKPGFLQRLSIFNIGRRKTVAPEDRDSVGFSRAVEAI